MAQKILLRRGPVGNIPSVATLQGELLLVTGSISALAGPFITMTGTSGTGTSTIVGKIYEGASAPSISSYSQLTGTPFYATGNNTLYRLNHAGNQALNLSGNLEGTTVSAMTVTTLTGTTINVSGDITGSNLQLSGNANIDGNITLGGNITIGDQNTDNISLGGEFTSDLIPDEDDTYAVGSSDRRWQLFGVNSSITGSFNGDFTGTLSSGTSLFSIAGGGDGSGTDAIAAGDTITFTNASTHGFDFDITNNQVSLATPQDLRATASPTFAGASLDAVRIGVTAAGEIDTTSGNLTLDSAGGTVIVDDNLTVNGATVVLDNIPTGTDNTVLILNSSNQVVTDEIDSRVWGSTLLDGGGSLTATRVPFVSDSNTLTDDAGLTYTAATDTLNVGTSTFGTNVTITGDLTVNGTTTTVNSTEVEIGDRIITLNAAGAAADGGIEVVDSLTTAHTGSLLWNAADDFWYAGISGSTLYRLATYTNQSPTTNAIPKVDSNKRLVASNIADTGTQIDFSADLDMNSNDIVGVNSITISGLTAASFVHTDDSSALTTVTPSTAGDLLQWDGGAFIASNVVDGGTF